MVVFSKLSLMETSIAVSSKWGSCIRTTDELLQAILSNLDSQQDLCSQKKTPDKNLDLSMASTDKIDNPQDITTIAVPVTSTNNLQDHDKNYDIHLPHTRAKSSPTKSNKISSTPSASPPLITQYNINDSQVSDRHHLSLSPPWFTLLLPLLVSIFSHQSPNKDGS